MRTSVTLLFCILGILPQPSLTQVNLCGFFDYVNPYFQNVFTDIEYMLFTRTNPKDSCDLQPDINAIRKCNFNPNRGTKIIVHGWVPYPISEDSGLDIDLKDKLLKAGDYNVVVVNWSAYSVPYNFTKSMDVNYLLCAFVGIPVGIKISSWIQFLQKYAGADPHTMHMYGHSLGAGLVAVAAKTTCTIGQITYLDAAAPVYRDLPTFLRPYHYDADFVEEIHSSDAHAASNGYGFSIDIARIDYYPNGGKDQPNCYKGAKFSNELGYSVTDHNKETAISCNHESSYHFYLHSFDKNCKFLGRICDSWENYTNGKCSRNPECRMGFYSEKIPNLPIPTRCYLKTSPKAPYCLG